MASAVCPDCGHMVPVEGKPKKGQWVVCSHCNADLEVVNLSPLELDWAYYEESDDEEQFWDEEEVWDDDEEDFWDEEEEEF